MIRTPAFRFAAYYGAFYLLLGCFLPYFPQWLDGRGMSPEWIGWIVAAGMAGRTLVSPIGARWSDRAARRRDPILVFAIACVVVFGLHGPVDLPWVLLVLSFLSGALVFGQIPVTDAFAMRVARDDRFAFGPVRAFGSAMFIVANFAAGALIDRFGSESILAWLILAAGLLALAATWLPEGRRPATHQADTARLGHVAGMLAGPLGIALLASAMVQAGHGFYYAFSAKAWDEQGLSATAIGALWSTGVAFEIAFLWLSGRGLLGRASPGPAAGGGGGGLHPALGADGLVAAALGAVCTAILACGDLCRHLCRVPPVRVRTCTRRTCRAGPGPQLGPVRRAGHGGRLGRVGILLCADRSRRVCHHGDSGRVWPGGRSFAAPRPGPPAPGKNQLGSGS